MHTTLNDSSYTALKELVQQLTLLKMTTTSPPESALTAGSLVVFQPKSPGKRPKKVEVFRSVHESLRGPNGKAYGRNIKDTFLRIASGTEALSEGDSKILRDCGLDEKQLAYVNRRLSTLAGPARARERAMDILAAKEKLKFVVTLSESAPSLAKDLRAILTSALHEIGGSVEVNVGSIEAEGGVPTESLTDTLVSLNRSCKEAQALYKSLPKGGLPDDLVLEFQRSWFSYTDMVSTFRNRKCFSRPPGWSGLRAQIQTGHVYKNGAPIGDEKPPTNSSAG